MLEVEVKYRVADPEDYERRVRELTGALFSAETVEEDVFFRNDASGFPGGGKTLRLRNAGGTFVATFKGPRLDQLTKTREEIELPLESLPGEPDVTLEAWLRFFDRLGFVRAAGVRKARRSASFEFAGRRFEATLDRLEGLGSFAELETIAEESEFQAARDAALELAARLGLRDSVTKSYLALAQEAETGAEVEEP